MAKVTIQNGQFQDAAGTLQAGSLVLQLSQDAVVSGTGQVAPKAISIAVVAGQAAATPVWGNDNLTPSGTVYVARLFDTSGAAVWGPENWSITGAGPIEINTLVPASSSISYPAAIITAPSADQTISADNLLPASGNTTQSLGSSAAPWNAVFGTQTVGKWNNIRIVDGVKFTTIAAAVADLPTVSLGGNSYAIGTVYIPAGTYSISSTLTCSQYVRLIGEGSGRVTINCTVVGDCIKFTNTPAITNSGIGGIEGVSLVGNAATGQIGVHAIDQTCGFAIKDVTFTGFTGTSASGLTFSNSTDWTERTFLQSVSFTHNTTGMVLAGGTNNSFGHNTWLDLHFNLNASQTAISMTGNALLYASVITGVINHDNSTGTSTVFNLAGTASVTNTTLLNLLSDNSGGGTAQGISSIAGTSFAASGNFLGYTANSISGTFQTSLPASGLASAFPYLLAPASFGIGTGAGANGVFLIPQTGAAGNFYQGIGFNVQFNGTNFVTISDGTNNGGSLILTSEASNGSLKFYSIPSTGNTVQTISAATLDSTYLRGTLDNTGFTINETIVGQLSKGSAVFALDTSATGTSVTNTTIITPFGNANDFAGLFMVSELNGGTHAIFLTGGGTMTLVSQTGTSFSTTSGTASKVNVFLTSLVVQIENKLGSTAEIRVTAIRDRNQQ